MGEQFEIERFDRAHERAIVELVVLTLDRHPSFGASADDRVGRVRTKFVRAMLADYDERGTVCAAFVGARCAVVAAWLGPEAVTRTVVHRLQIDRRAVGIGGVNGRRRAQQLTTELRRARPTGPHFRLSVPGLGPRDEGLLPSVLAPLLAAADERGLPIYAETVLAELRSSLEALAFRTTQAVSGSTAQPVWRLWREPQLP